MKAFIKKTTWMAAGALFALTAGVPAFADDTELLLVNPNEGTDTTPNVLLIIDSSGSMGTNEETRKVYDYTQTYTGSSTPCDTNYLYWTEYKKVVPSCDPTNTRRILKSSFLCDAATKQLEGIGTYRSKMIQYRDGGSGFFSIFLGLDAKRWQKLEPGNDKDLVECEKDRGDHGDGVNTSDLYAQTGGDVAPYTSDRKDEVSWRSWPTNQSVTVYDGNYLNYRENPVLIQDSRINIVQNTATAILNSIEGINVGVMRFNGGQGGPVIQAMEDLDSNRADILARINGINSGGPTPVSETFYEAALYWHGLPAYYGENVNEHATDPNALISDTPEIYKQPESPVCAKNFNVILTDGAPTEDVETQSLVDSLPDWGTTLGYAGCTGGTGNGQCLDDIAEYLLQNDISTEPGVQVVTTHTIGFSVDLPILKETAQRGGGDYFLADDVTSLTLALLEIVNDIQDRSLSFAAPAVAVNTFNRTQNLNDLYLTTFAASTKVHWPGNLKKYRIVDGKVVDANGLDAVNPATGLFNDTAQSFWSTAVDGSDVRLGGAVENLPDPLVRKVYTNITVNDNLAAAANAVAEANEATFSLADFGLTGAANEPTILEIIKFARGEDITDQDNDPTTTVRRMMGDPLHSQPAAISYGGTPTAPDLVVYTATNDGYVHAIDADTGQELWAFIPREHLPKLSNLFFNADAPFKTYGVDGDIVPIVADRDNDGIIEQGDGDFVYIIFGMRRGGDTYYALDVTDRNSPKVKWRVSAPEFGQTWSRPTVAVIDIDDPGLNSDKAVVVIGGGYDTAHDTLTHPATADTQGAGIFFLDLESGDILWRAGADVGADLQLPSMTRAIPTQVRVVDINGDDLADRMYASDMGGQIFRFDIFNGNKPDGIGNDALVTGGVVAQLGAEGNSVGDEDTRRFYTTPDVSVFNDNAQNRRFIAISIGSGYRASPLDNTPNERFYSIRDRNVFNQLSQPEYNAIVPVKDGDLVEIAGTVGTQIGQNQDGWRFTLPADQKVLSTSATFNNEIFFVAFSPDSANAAQCAAGAGANFLYRVSVINGDPIADLDNLAPGSEDAARVSDLAQGGIAPSPAFLFPSPDPSCTGEDCNPPPIYCVGVECRDPGFDNNPVRTLWTQDGID
ncbi:MAG: PilC/PilY family type IV pilus protein [Woeseiaceae bacterium]|nr:PilC/PilY family type IV pilus protein [Woeseiaceae bacterium]